jgi:hypothetical protein
MTVSAMNAHLAAKRPQRGAGAGRRVGTPTGWADRWVASWQGYRFGKTLGPGHNATPQQPEENPSA